MIEANPNFYANTVVVMFPQDSSPSFAGNVHRVILRMETDTDYFGWPDPTDSRNSDNWKPVVDQPLQYPKFAWKAVILA